ncbi:hypothetical protein BDR07DRAFT_1490591 [Suillus spraguei]|nr:hypothetical protein BDR07DRAFT_1490591 [Suillus spraguei]
MSNIIHDDQVVGWKFKGESYYMGLLLKNIYHDRLELVASPHISDISLHLESRWDKPFMKETIVAFLMQFLRVGDSARIIKGSLCGELRKQYFKPPKSDSIQIWDSIEVQEGEHKGKHGVMDWCAKGDTNIWFQDIFILKNTELSSISVPAAIVQRTDIGKIIQYTKERGYDIRPGDVMTVICGSEYEVKGVVQLIDFPNAHLTLLCHGNHSLLNVPIKFVMKVHDANLDHFKKDIGTEVFIIAGEQKGFQATLHSFGPKTCIFAMCGQKVIQLKPYKVANMFS